MENFKGCSSTDLQTKVDKNKIGYMTEEERLKLKRCWKLKDELYNGSSSAIKLEIRLSDCDDEDSVYPASKKKVTRDPLSHRIIEKRRRDRMNSCLADLSRLIPHEYMKKGRGRVEKNEVIEMAIKCIKQLKNKNEDSWSTERLALSYKLGFSECFQETIQYLVQFEAMSPNDPFCTSLQTHLFRHRDSIVHSETLMNRIAYARDDDLKLSENDGSTQDTGSDSSLGQNLSPSSSNSEKGNEQPGLNYKFKNLIQKRFEKAVKFDKANGLVPVFVLAPGGAHYLATWLEPGLIPGYSELSIGELPPTPHTVTISVDFQPRVGTL